MVTGDWLCRAGSGCRVEVVDAAVAADGLELGAGVKPSLLLGCWAVEEKINWLIVLLMGPKVVAVAVDDGLECCVDVIATTAGLLLLLLLA